MDRLIRLVKIAHRYPSDYISSQISEMLEDFPAYTPMHRLASLCISYPCVMDNCGHLVSFSSIRVASDDPIPFLFRIAQKGPSQSELNQAGRQKKRFQNRAPVGEGKKVKRKEDKHGEGPEASLDFVHENISKYKTISPRMKGEMVKKIVHVLRGDEKRRSNPEARKFTELIQNAGRIRDPRKRNLMKMKLITQYLHIAENVLEERKRESEKPKKKPKKKPNRQQGSNSSGTQSVMSNKPKPSSSSSNSSSPSKPSSGSSSNSSSSSSAPASTFKSL